jgi:hypothetical protein
LLFIKGRGLGKRGGEAPSLKISPPRMLVGWGGRMGAWRNRKLLKRGEMKDYIVTAQIKLEVQARNEAEAKQITMEDLSDFMRHNSLADLMEVREKE